VLLLSGKWLVGLAHVGLLLYNSLLLSRKRHTVDVTEVFKDLPRLKTQRMIKLTVFVMAFIITIYKCVLPTQYKTRLEYCTAPLDKPSVQCAALGI
jgi:Cornichon protein